MIYKKCLWIFFLLFGALVINAQPSYIYEGGDGGGFSSDKAIASNTLLYKGGGSDGYSGSIVLNQNNFVFKGGEGDGFSETNVDDTNIFLYAGGDAQGYAQDEKCEDFVWTGVIGTGWLVQGNWNYNKVPDLKRRVIIPSGTPHHPAVHAGLFSIGDNPNNGQFKCGEIWIQENALFVARVNNKIENYGNITIDGTMLVRNTSVDAFQNLTDGLIRVSSTGSLTIKP